MIYLKKISVFQFSPFSAYISFIFSFFLVLGIDQMATGMVSMYYGTKLYTQSL